MFNPIRAIRRFWKTRFGDWKEEPTPTPKPINCEFCGAEFKTVGYLDRFHCKYCEKYFCEKHRLPEKHNCSGDPRALPKLNRELHSGGKTTVLSK